MFFLSLAFAQDPIHPESIIRFDQEWLVWSGTQEPPQWPIVTLPASKSGLSKISPDLRKYPDRLVLGADSVIDLESKLISKPKSREEALQNLLKLNGKKHYLISSVCLSKNGSMIWHYTDTSTLIMKNLKLDELKSYLNKIKDEELYAYGVYQIEANGKSLFSKIDGNEDSIMGLPIKQIKEYIKNL